MTDAEEIPRWQKKCGISMIKGSNSIDIGKIFELILEGEYFTINIFDSY